MHTLFHHTLKNFFVTVYSTDQYLQILNQAGLDSTQFEAEQYHNDLEVNQVILAGQSLLNKTRDELLFDIGLHNAPGLLATFKDFLEPHWDVLDLIEQVETRMHKHVREEAGAFPPSLQPTRIDDNSLRVKVRSHRNMAGLAEGFIQGFARHYGDTIAIDIDADELGYSFLIQKVTA